MKNRTTIFVVPPSSEKYKQQDFHDIEPGTLIEFSDGALAIFCESRMNKTGYVLVSLDTYMVDDVDPAEICDFRVLKNPTLTYQE